MTGLSDEEALRRLKINGRNKLAQKKNKTVMKIFANQFRDFMVMILLGATVISAILGEIYDAVTIIIIVILNAALGFIQEYKTEHTLEALEKMTSPTAKVYRNGVLKTISAEEIVEGDIFEVEAGDRIPCDAFILSGKNFTCDESVLTGESLPVLKKNREKELESQSLNLPYMAYMGTICVKGNARCEALHTGKTTQIGRVSNMLEEIDEELTPLQKKLAELGKILGLVCLMVCIVVFLAGILRGEPFFDMLMTGITVAIAAIPEGLPATVTIALALAVRRMLKRNALVHRLHSVETLGCATVICTDKTGTITENKMTVSDIFAGGNTFRITGVGYNKNGNLLFNGMKANPDDYPSTKLLMECFVNCNNAAISDYNADGRNRKYKAVYTAVGDPTESALLIAAAKTGVTSQTVNSKRLDEIPFDSAARSMTVTVKNSDGNVVSYTKGALDILLYKSTHFQTDCKVILLDEKIREKITKIGDEYAKKGLRVLGFSKSENGETVFLGLCGMQDPLRSEAKKAIASCEKAHIKTVMITGDHKLTACAIAKEAGILKEGDLALTGDELSKMSDSELSECIHKVSVFARISPDHKLRIVKAFKNKGHIVAMTGDGVNDAPAIKEADIGVSMGISGTDVSKQAADVILLDDNFNTLTHAVLQGRTIYANIRKFVRYLISCNIGEIMTMLMGMLMGLPVVLLPTQILLVNLATDGLPAIALGLEPADKSVMEKPPRKNTDSFFAGGLMSRIVFRGILIGLFTVLSFILGLKLSGSVIVARTCALFTLVMSQLIHVFECKSEEKNLFTVPLLNNIWLISAVVVSALCLMVAVYFPPLQLVFSTVSLNLKQLLCSFGCAVCVPVGACFIHKKK
ncbi:MAG: cation-translocating P-type ATPase [Ruminococcus sp.]|nr:cation-translocating P-type ATPase [Ruminococcus sp.]